MAWEHRHCVNHSISGSTACNFWSPQVVSGLEPENTNIFLQMLGKACMLTDGADVVQVGCSAAIGLGPRLSLPGPHIHGCEVVRYDG